MKTIFYVIDPDGDVKLVLREPNSHQVIPEIHSDDSSNHSDLPESDVDNPPPTGRYTTGVGQMLESHNQLNRTRTKLSSDDTRRFFNCLKSKRPTAINSTFQSTAGSAAQPSEYHPKQALRAIRGIIDPLVFHTQRSNTSRSLANVHRSSNQKNELLTNQQPNDTPKLLNYEKTNYPPLDFMQRHSETMRYLISRTGVTTTSRALLSSEMRSKQMTPQFITSLRYHPTTRV
ncbi:hypothetical protein FBULB1_8815 [Fusarium bulbicola]|nr:hypothetical protein FBULB1_8815 [Fusarium bulbicola]